MNIKIVILAAGKGKRLASLGYDVPKPLIPIQGKPIVMYLIEAIRNSTVGGDPIVITAKDNKKLFCETLGANTCQFVVQKKQLGTGHAVMCAKDVFGNADHVMVLYGDHPTLSSETISRLAKAHDTSGATLTMMTVKFPDFKSWRQWFYGFGRIKRDEQGKLVGIIEKKDCNKEELQITEVNPAYMIFKRSWLCKNLDTLTNKNAQEEYYLTDLVNLAFEQHEPIHDIIVENAIEAIGINTPEQLKAAEEALGKLNL